MRWRLAAAAAVAVLLTALSIYKPSPPKLVAPVDIEKLAELVKSDPALLEEAVRYMSELGVNLTLRAPPKPQPTAITISINASSIWAGDRVLVTGVLTSRGKPLAGQTVAVLVDGVPAAVTVTDSRGRYNATVAISVYRPRVNVTAVYLPLPGSPYMPSMASAHLSVLYHATTIAISAPSQVLWGAPLALNITLDPPAERRINIVLGNATTSILLSLKAQGSASVIIPTGNLTPGTYNLTVYVPGKGRLGPATARRTVDIIAESPVISLSAAGVEVAGFPPQFAVKVVPAVNISVYLGDKPLKGAIPLDTPTGWAVIRAVSMPSPPYASATASAYVFVVNPLQISAVIAAVLLAMKFVQGRLQRATNLVREVVEAAPRSPRNVVEEEALAVLARAFYKLGERSGLWYSRKMTYREYASSVEPYAKDPTCLWRVVYIAEKAAYSPYSPSAVEIREAWVCTERL
ncbi:hypothetical protein [Pyrobaculum ferrireducens]|uniref:Uncharacterized protein n=1 Tax=Pyrobaculum ferrireducens TaxID=1104324 RepID=G7VIH1_9CREN|nr:hypothetical protein [Pyrobaculum ferrireducens]AET33451.1 hypothetical protein P186_2056 [Pyrobaculum ferrireducens]